MANVCLSCGVSTALLPSNLCAPCDNAHDIALRTQDIILPCYTCGDDVTVSVVMAATGLTRIAAVFCSERCSDIDCEHNCEELREMTEHDEEEEAAHVRQPFTSEVPKGWESVDTSVEDDDCPF